MSRRQFLKTMGAMGMVVGTGALASAIPLTAAAEPDSPPAGNPIVRAGTFSLCAVDPKAGEAGVVVASRCLSVGGLVPYAAPGVGAIATQATLNPSYGPAGLDLLRKGIPPAELVKRLTSQDVIVTGDDDQSLKRYAGEGLTEEGLDFLHDPREKRILWFASRMRQLGVVDREGHAAVFTGARCVEWAGSLTGPGFSCQGNMLAGEKVVRDMAGAFEAARHDGRPLVAALLSALQAGEAAGGDKRGRQAAAILVTRDRGHWTGSDRWCDVRVDDHPDPVPELTRILKKNGFVS